MDSIKLFLYCFYIFCTLISIQSCGSDRNSIEKNNYIKIISIDSNTPLYEQSDASVTGKILAPKSLNLTYQWHQISGIPLTLIDKNQQTLTFTTPSLTTNESVRLKLTVQDANNYTQTKEVTLTLLYINTPPIVEIEKHIIVNELSEVMLTGNVFDEEGEVTSLWQQKSGTTVEITPLKNSGLSFQSPKVAAIETLTFELTAIDSDGANAKETASVIVLPTVVEIPQHVLLLTNERINKVKIKITKDSTAWDVLTSKINNYFVKVPYNAGEYAGSFALAFYLSGDVKYIQRTIELLEHAYFTEPDIGWQYYNSRNLFRENARWAIMGYTWIKSYLIEAQRIKIENILALWSNYWLDHVDFQNDFESFRIEDTDNLTSLAENLTLLGYALSDSSQHANLSQQLLNAGDSLLNRFVVDYYMNDIMAGGAWAEGSDYSPNTQRHWIRTFMINKDQRNIPYPTNYAHDAMLGLLHQTLADYSGMYKYGDEELATDHEALSDDYRYEFALELMGLLENEKDLSQLSKWFNTLLAREGFKKGSMVTNFQRLLTHDPLLNSNFPAYPESTLNISPGIGLVSTRTNWSEDSTNLFFINRKLRVDHEHKDALSFDIAFKGKWLSKERSGYSGPATTSTAHNTILIENATSDGSSSPTYRPAGDPSFYEIFDDNDITIISAEATNTYNMIGYFATNYAKQVNRQIVFIKPSTLVVYDHVVTDKSETKDLIRYKLPNLTPGIDHTRWVKIIQHVQAYPIPLSDYPQSYQIVSEGNKLVYQVHWPLDAKINIIDEAALWKDVAEYEVPENQKKWHFEVTNEKPIENNEFITTLNFGQNIDGVNYAIAPIIMSKENGLILQGNVKGIALQVNGKAIIILFNQTPQLSITKGDYIKPQGFESAKVYGVSLNLNDSVAEK
jgi:hypothetical protein